MTTPYEAVRAAFEVPGEERDYQVKAINDLAPLPRSGWYAEVSTGKTYMSTFAALYKKLHGTAHHIVIMPPILLDQWYRWLTSIRDVSVVIYRGTPSERQHLNIDKDFILMTIQIFKRDFAYLEQHFEFQAVAGIVDEATAIKNAASGNYKKVRNFFAGRDLMLLTGTPLSKPGDAYAYIKLVSPTIYRNQRHFEAIHVAERDYFGNVTKWQNLDLLSDNLMLNSVRILKEEAHKNRKQPIYIPIYYKLDDAHYALYKQLSEEQLLLLEDGRKIDATTATRLYNCCQQIVCNPSYFSGDPNMRSAAHELLDETLDELGAGDVEHGGKLIIYSNYKMTNRGLVEYLKPYNAVACYGEVTAKRQSENMERFKHDPACRVLVAQPTSAGYGTDGLQFVCSDVLFMETPIVPRDFHQGVGRVDRGQKIPPRIRIAVAKDTIQVSLFDRVMQKDELVSQVQGAHKTLRDAIFGKEESAV